MKLFEHKEKYYLSLDNGSEYEVDIEADYSPEQKQDMTDPHYPAEFCVTEVRLSDNDFQIELDWIKNLGDFQDEMISNRNSRRVV